MWRGLGLKGGLALGSRGDLGRVAMAFERVRSKSSVGWGIH